MSSSQTDLVGRELAKGEIPEAGLLRAADAVLAARPRPATGLEPGDVGVVLIGENDLEAVPVVVGVGHLGSRVRAPRRQMARERSGQAEKFEVKLGHPGAVSRIPLGGHGGRPGGLVKGEDGRGHVLEADREKTPRVAHRAPKASAQRGCPARGRLHGPRTSSKRPGHGSDRDG
jgi:hypothetical protein